MESNVYRVVDSLAAWLSAHVDHVFGVGGANIEDLFDALHAHVGVQPVLAKHEFSAGAMAEAYARARNDVGVVMTTSGAGALNVIPALGEAHASRMPVMAIIGEPMQTLNGRGSFQDTSGHGGSFDLQAVLTPLTKRAVRLSDGGELVSTLADLYNIAITKPRGPVALILPKDVQRQPSHSVVEPAQATEAPEDHFDVLSAGLPSFVELLEQARRDGPAVIIAGSGIATARQRQLLSSLADRLDARVVVTPEARHVFDNTNPRFRGVVGVMGHPTAQETLRSASACLAVGTRLPAIARQGLSLDPKMLFTVGDELPFIGSTHTSVDLEETLHVLESRLPQAPSSLTPQPHHRNDVRPKGGIGAFLAELDDALRPGEHVYIDAGNTGAAAIHHLSAPFDGRMHVALGMGGMGYTFGAAIGAAMSGEVNGRVYVVAGDGSFFMHGLEIHTAIEHDLPITYVIFDNAAHGMCATRERAFFGGDYSYNRFQPARIGSGLSTMFPSLPARDVEDAAEFRATLMEFSSVAGPSLIAVATDVNELPPFGDLANARDRDHLDAPITPPTLPSPGLIQTKTLERT